MKVNKYLEMNKNEKTTQKTLLLQLVQQLEEVFVALDSFLRYEKICIYIKKLKPVK